MERRGFYPREGRPRGKASQPYHVALEDSYIRAHWSTIDMLCKLNGAPFNATGETIQQDGLWCVYELTWQNRCHPVLGSASGALAARQRISLSRAAPGSAANERAQGLADIPSKARKVARHGNGHKHQSNLDRQPSSAITSLNAKTLPQEKNHSCRAAVVFRHILIGGGRG
jgi:hypothetical protein